MSGQKSTPIVPVPDRSTLNTVDRAFLTTFDIIAWIYKLIRFIPYGRKVVKKCVDSPQFKQIFDEADVHDNGALGKEEVYTLVLRFYLFVAQYTFVVARHIPTREDVNNIISHGDINKDGVLGFDEFKTVILLLCEGVATQLAAQLVFTVLLSPLLALCLIFVLKHLFIFFPVLLKQFWFIPSFLCNDKVGLLVFVPTLNALVLPYYLEYVFYIQTLRNPNKARFVPDMSQFQSIPSPLESLKEITEELSEMAERHVEASSSLEKKAEGSSSENTPSGSEDDLVILEKDDVSKKED